MCSESGLRGWCILIGCLLVIVSVGGIGLSLFLIFDDPFYDSQLSQGTYEPNFEDIGPTMVVSVVSLLINVMLVGGAKQGSKDMLLAWTVWKLIVVFLFWAWYGYNQLKFYSYIKVWEHDWMKTCTFCGDEYTEQYVVMGGAIASAVLLVCLVPVEMLRSKLKKRHRELTELLPSSTSMQYMAGSGDQLSSHQLIEQHPNFYPIQPQYHHPPPQQSHMQQYLLQQQQQMQQQYNLQQQQYNLQQQQQQQLKPNNPTLYYNY